MIRSRYAFLSSVLATCAVALCTAVPLTLQAASSYFMIQGPFGSGGAYETFKFRVEYTGVLSVPGFEPEEQNTGLTMLAAIFGNGTSTQPYSNSVGSVSFSSGFLNGFSMHGSSLVVGGFNYPADPQWNYFVSGGGYINTYPPELPPTTGTYDSSTWTASYTGATDRILVNGSIDAWSYAQHVYSGYTDPIWGPIYNPPNPTGVGPTLADFAGIETLVSANGLPYKVYMIVPEPGRALLFVFGLGLVVVRRSRRQPVGCKD